ncbi:hypothetical protein DSOL_4523 [Desulfosporosinus metallidurans]|uniref:Uncharacterized protein n=1 Tax=Desulfosporosinus metallidurans TaxID=1888891 RepID=A0A1Q8QJE8_9FIRM|nr:hypothetical protein DSOL_4523 [Desulfosporosinus metallidurans]
MGKVKFYAWATVRPKDLGLSSDLLKNLVFLQLERYNNV